MNNPYDIHAWSRQYREDALREARACCALKRSRDRVRRAPEPGRVGMVLKGVLGSLLRAARVAG